MGLNPISIFCPHCLRYTSLTIARTKYKDHYGYVAIVPCIWEKTDILKWWIGFCNNCKNPVLVLNRGQVIYPNPKPPPTDERIPKTIRKDFNEAKLTFNIDAYRACAVMARRALQSTCIDKGASKDENLVNQIKELFDKNIFTKDIKEWADTVRWVGNDAAHPNSPEVLKEDAKDILNLVDQFLKVVYVAPAIAKERKIKRKK